MPDDFFPELDTKGSASKADFFPELDKSAKPEKDSSFVGRATRAINRVGPAFASNVLPGLAEIPEQIINAGQYASRNMHPLLNPQAQLLPSLSPIIDPLNKAAGASAQPYLDITGAMKNQPIPSWGNQTPNQLMQQQPIAGTAGNLAGSLAASPLLGPGLLGELGSKIPALAKLGPLAGKVIGGALAGGEYSALQGGLENAGNQIKANDTLDPIKAALAGEKNFLPGALMGGGMGLLGAALSKTTRPGSKTPLQLGHTPAVGTPKALGYTPNKPKRIGMKKGPFFLGENLPQGPKLIERKLIPPGPAERKRMESELYNPGFRHTETVYAEVLPPENKAMKKASKVKEKKDASKITITTSPVPPRQAVEGKVEEISFPDQSWRERRQAQARPATAQESPLLKRLGRLKILEDEAHGKLQGALKEIYRELKLEAPTKKGHIEPQYRDIVTKVAKDLGGTPENRTAYIEATLAPGDQTPQYYEFKKQGLRGHIEELKELDSKYKEAKGNYDRFKDNREERFTETLPVNETAQVQITDGKGKTYSVNVKRVWRPTKYEFPDAKSKVQYEATKQYYENLSSGYPELTTSAFKKVIVDAANKGQLPDIDYLAKTGSLDWLKKLDKDTKTKLLLAIGLAASAYLGAEQEANAAPPPNLFGKVINSLAKGGWKPWMGSRPITRITQLEVTSDMIRKGFDVQSKMFALKRTNYLADLTRALVGSREMNEVEKQATQGLQPYELRHTPALTGWTQMERNKAGDIAELNKKYKQEVTDERERLRSLGVEPKHYGAAQRYARGVEIDAHDMGVYLEKNPMGNSSEGLDKITGEIMMSEFLGNTRVAALHMGEAVVASASKFPKAFGQAIHGLSTNPVYREYALANSPKGFFQQTLERQNTFEWRKKVSAAINEPIDKAIKSMPHGEIIYQALSAQLPERGKLGFNSVVIAQEVAKDYPGGPEMYMRRWLANAKNRTPIPQNEQLVFAKTALKAAIEENIATAKLPEGPIKERTVFQRNKALGFFFPYTRGKVIQSRFFTSLADDFLHALSIGDKEAALHSAKALMTASLLVGAVSGSAAVPGYIWGAFEQIDQVMYGTTKDVEAMKENIDKLQGSVTGGYQMREFGIAGLAFTRLPTPALESMWDRLIRDANPKSKMDIVRGLFDFVTVSFLSRVGPIGTLNIDYFLERLVKGIKGSEQFRQYESSLPGTLMDQIQRRPFGTKLIDKKLPFDIGQGISHGLLNIQNRDEVKAIQQAEKKSSANWRKDTQKYVSGIKKALKK